MLPAPCPAQCDPRGRRSLRPTRTNKAILKRTLETTVQGNRFGQRMMLFTNRSGWHQSLADLADSLTFRSKADYENYLTRLADLPRAQ